MDEVTCWVLHALSRVFPATNGSANRAIDLAAARGERVSFQVCVRNRGSSAVPVTVSYEVSDGVGLRVRRVGTVPVRHHNTGTDICDLDGVGAIPGLVPDPLFDETSATVGPQETQTFWLTVSVPRDAKPGSRFVNVTVRADGEVLPALEARVRVGELVSEPITDFPVTHWFYADALCDWYHVTPWDDAFWKIVRTYMANSVEHGVSCQYVPIFTPPTDGVKRPTQLLRVRETSAGKYEFGFEDVLRWVRLAEECGSRFLEWTHLFTQWGVEHGIRVYRSNADPTSLLWPPETPATGEVYRGFLAQFLPAFEQFLRAENLLDRSFFHLSDEPGEEHLENYRAARTMLKELAPWMKVCDALSDVRFGKEGLTDIPVPSIGTAKDYLAAGISSWVYFCCGPRGRFLNRLMDTPLPKIRMSGWLFHRFQARGFLHWGHNYWYRSQTQELIDPFAEQAGEAWPGWAYGDPFVVYPGPEGPIDSIRWEVFADSLQDMALLRAANVSPDDPMLQQLEGYDMFPCDEEWILSARRRLVQAD